MASSPEQRRRSTDSLAAVLESLEITPFQKNLLRDRWLDQMTWMGRKSREARRSFYLYRIPVVVGGVLIPALVTILLSSGTNTQIVWLGGFPVDGIRFLAFAVSLLVAVCAGVEELLHFGDRWRHYRRTAELLKTLGWQYMMLNGAFRRYSSHAAAFGAFTERVEDVLNEDVEGYLGTMAGDGPERQKHEIIA